MVIVTHSKEETQRLAKQMSHYLKAGMVIRLDGQLGSGKTTFVQGVGKALNISRAIKSPTYTIVKSYSTPLGNLVHIDAYRLEDADGDTIDLPYLMNDQAIVFIEWAEFIEEELPESYLQLTFTYRNDIERQIDIQVINPINDHYTEIMTAIENWSENL